MTAFAAVLSAIAASIAAILTAVNLVLTGRREDVKWARESMDDAFMTFLDASFSAKDRCKRLCRLAATEGGVSDEQRETLLREAAESVDTMSSQVSRLRLLAPESVAFRGRALLMANQAFLEAVSGDPRALALVDDTEFRTRINTARDALTSAAKWFMRIR